MADIVLTTLNARYIHASFGLRYLIANLGVLRDKSSLREFVINDNPIEVLAEILAEQPRIIGFGVYIWNVEQTTKIVSAIKQVRPEIRIVLGGPEVSYKCENLEVVQLADFVISGEADVAFRELCEAILNDESPPQKLIQASVPELNQVVLPYEEYNADDLAHRVLYVEISRGCPFTCEFCLSSLEIPVRMFALENFLDAMQRLLERGARQFKFVDRTFNLNLRVSSAILQFFLDRYEPGMFLHFEMIPDRLPMSLRDLIAQFPPGALQFEIGIQSFNPEVGTLINRRQDYDKLEDNFEFLRSQTGVHVHADLIVGLPGEDWDSFAAGFDRLHALRPQEIQIGILKRLRGTPIQRHDTQWSMIYSPHPPYEILQNRLLTFDQVNRLRRFAKFWDSVGNSGNFLHTLPLLCPPENSAFDSFVHFSDWLYSQTGQLHGISLVRLYELTMRYLVEQRTLDAQTVAETVWRDYLRGNRRAKPAFFKPFSLDHIATTVVAESDLPERQAKHLAR